MIQERAMSSSRRVLLKIILDFTFLAIPGLFVLLLFLVGSPFERGFFCNDESLLHPYKDDTITLLMLILVGGIFAILLFIGVEVFRAVKNLDSEGKIVVLFNWNVPTCVQKLYQYIGLFLFGMASNQFLTDVAKYSAGRLRPHFFAVCRPQMPDGSTCSDSINFHRYIQDFVCTNTDSTERMLREMRLSFPSGHASYGFYTLIFCAFYIQSRITWKGSKLMKHFIQLLLFTGSWYTALSRISDYKHHWSDVLAGGIIGIFVAFTIVFYATDLFKQNKSRAVRVKNEDEQPV